MQHKEMSRTDGALFLLRLGVGLLFVWGGLGKLIGPALGGPPLAGFAEQMVWGQLWLATLVAVAELLGGVALLSGLLTRYAAAVLGVITLVALVTVHLPGQTPVSGTPLGMVFILLHVSLLTQLAAIGIMGPGNANFRFQKH